MKSCDTFRLGCDKKSISIDDKAIVYLFWSSIEDPVRDTPALYWLPSATRLQLGTHYLLIYIYSLLYINLLNVLILVR